MVRFDAKAKRWPPHGLQTHPRQYAKLVDYVSTPYLKHRRSHLYVQEADGLLCEEWGETAHTFAAGRRSHCVLCASD
jgi:hypothetical protein